MSMKDRLRSVRAWYDLRQEEMAARFGLGDASWKRLELEGRAPKGDVLEQLADDGFNLNWLMTGRGEMRGGQPMLNDRLLVEAILIVEEWLAANKRVMPPEKKADVIGEIYAMALEETEEGKELDARKVGRILRLVV